MGIVGEHDEEVLVILAREHGVATVDAARKERQPLVLDGVAVQCENAKVEEVLRLDQLRQDDVPVIRGVCRVVCHFGHLAVIFREPDEARVLDAVGLVGRNGKDDAFAERELIVEVQFVVGDGEPVDAFEGELHLARHGLIKPPHLADAVVQVAKREVLRQRFHDLAGVTFAYASVFETHLVQFDDKELFLIGWIGHDIRQGDESRNGIHGDVAVRGDHAGPELDRRDVAFSRGAQAHDEPETALGHAGLVRVSDHGRVEERGGFHRVFPGEGRADQKLPRARDRALGEDLRTDRLVNFHQTRFEIQVPLREIVPQNFHLVVRLLLRKREDATDHVGDLMRVGRDERTHDDARAVRLERHIMAAQVQGHQATDRGGAGIRC